MKSKGIVKSEISIYIKCIYENVENSRGKYLNVFREYVEGIYDYTEKTQKDSWRILLIRQETQNWAYLC